MELLSPNLGLAVWTILTFLVVLLILRRYAWKPILQSMEARERGIQRLIDDAEKERAEADALLAEYRRQLAGARDDAQRVLGEAKAAAERVREEMLERARAEAEGIVKRAGTEIDLERRKALAEIKEQAVGLAIAAAERVLEESLNDERHRQIVEDFLRSVESEPQIARGREPREG
jgi:F-type H+-transporting ATPase subunit b